MKRNQLVSLALMLMCIVYASKSSAQASKETPVTGFNIGGYLGLISSNLNQVPYSDYGSQLPVGTVGTVEVNPVSSTVLGIIAQYDLHKYFSLESGLSFLQQGTTLKITQTNIFGTTSVDATLKATYLQFPILAVGKFNADNFDFRLGLGGYFSTKVGESKSTTTSGFKLSDADAYTSLDAGIQYMGSLGYCFGKSKINITGRFNRGIAEILNGIDTQNGTRQASFNSINFGISYIYCIGN